jgi:hypothetical protein
LCYRLQALFDEKGGPVPRQRTNPLQGTSGNISVSAAEDGGADGTATSAIQSDQADQLQADSKGPGEVESSQQPPDSSCTFDAWVPCYDSDAPPPPPEPAHPALPEMRRRPALRQRLMRPRQSGDPPVDRFSINVLPPGDDSTAPFVDPWLPLLAPPPASSSAPTVVQDSRSRSRSRSRSSEGGFLGRGLFDDNDAAERASTLDGESDGDSSSESGSTSAGDDNDAEAGEGAGAEQDARGSEAAGGTVRFSLQRARAIAAVMSSLPGRSEAEPSALEALRAIVEQEQSSGGFAPPDTAASEQDSAPDAFTFTGFTFGTQQEDAQPLSSAFNFSFGQTPVVSAETTAAEAGEELPVCKICRHSLSRHNPGTWSKGLL